MLKNYFKIAFRNLIKNRIYSLLNITGLSIGLACVIVIVGYINLELSYDNFHDDYKDIYRISEIRKRQDRQDHTATTFNPMAELTKEYIPSVKHVVRMFPLTGFVSTTPENKSRETLFTLADSTIFEVFSFESLYGDLSETLDAPYSVVITESKALEYFGETSVIGQKLVYENATSKFNFSITGVIKDLPQNTHLNLDFLASFSSIRQIRPRYDNWFHPAIYAYVKLRKGFDVKVLEDGMKGLKDSHFPENIKSSRSHTAQPISGIHLRSALLNEWAPNSNIVYVTLFITIAFFILLIACINFMNLSTARSMSRSKEVGLRKVVGARKEQLIHQFLSESLLITTFSFIAAFVLAELAFRNGFNSLVEKQITSAFLFEGVNLFYVVLALVIVTLLAGTYPAFYLAQLRPISTLRGKTEQIGGVGNIRKVMVTFQFFISCLLIIGTLIVLSQINFLRNKNLGFDKEQIVAIGLVDQVDQKNYEQLQSAFLEETSVIETTVSSALPGGDGFYAFRIEPEGLPDGEQMTMKSIGVDEEYITTYRLEILEGRGFSKDVTTDESSAFILNEAAVEKLEWSDPLGKNFSIEIHGRGGADVRKGKVIGVLKDFHYESLYNSIEPLVVYVNTSSFYHNYLNLKIAPGNWEEVISLLEMKWEAFSPNRPLQFYFLDEELKKMYDAEVKIGRIFTAFAILSIVISCLGLFGLSAFTASQRTKEIGIRKVMGASLLTILKLLSKDYVILIVLANLIAWPLGWYYSSQWLNDFAYRVDLNLWTFLFTFLSALIVALITVSYQTMKAASANPVDALQQE